AVVPRRVELLAGRVVDAHVLDLDRVTGLGDVAVALDDVGGLEAGRGRPGGNRDLRLCGRVGRDRAGTAGVVAPAGAGNQDDCDDGDEHDGGADQYLGGVR